MASSSSYEALTALVVEDDEFTRQLVAQALGVIGFGAVSQAGDGEAAIKSCMDRLPDIIYCDIEMEPMNGIDFLKALRRTKLERVREMPVIFLTSHGESEIVREAMQAGVDAFILKPPTLKKLKDKTDALLDNS
ncbi:MAG: response regulator [Rhodospirillaceae bacterium]|jgi:two-component system, chemotaxis family, chemotaxis protein CheY|nr:response regulator [Rhodospirillaceae bacterium]MBT6139318.1 response regulator [Rhodospirillaceae bacterium]